MRSRGRLPDLALVIGVVAAAAAVYRRAGGFGFVWDDHGFILENPPVAAGLTREGLRWALGTFHTGNWHPLTWVSHMVDVELFGLDPGAHHLVNVALHAVNSALLYLVLRAMTGARAAAAVAAALFAVHPVHVESVAWVAERKDLLSALFWMLGLAAWTGYARRRTGARYAAALAAIALGAASKPTVVTLPLVLLLLDWWPLGRARRRGGIPGRTLLLEKAPLLALGAATAALALHAQSSVGAVVSTSAFPPAQRAANAVVACAEYLGTIVWPAKLAVFYPLVPGGRPPWQVAGAVGLLAALAAAAFAARRIAPALAAGGAWFVVTLLPVIGFVQVGWQARADRYLYLPLVGAGLAAAWGLPPLVRRLRVPAGALTALGVSSLAALAVAAAGQAEHWRSQRTLFERALAVTGGNWRAHNEYGVALQWEGRLAEGAGHFREAARIKPDAAEVQRNLGYALASLGRRAEGIAHLDRSLELRPGEPHALAIRGSLLAREGRHAEALEDLRAAVRHLPGRADVWTDLGVASASLGRREEAGAAWRRALEIEPGFPPAEANLQRLRRLGAAGP